MEHTGLVANELFEAGFNISMVVGFPVVEVWLDSREVTRMEVETVLNQSFEGCSFRVIRGVLKTVKGNPIGIRVRVE